MSKNVLITGCSSGLGLALTNLYLEKGYNVYGISRSNPNIQNNKFFFKAFDLSNISQIKTQLSEFIKSINSIETVYLNAGMLGEIKTSLDISIEELKEVYDLNVYTNKEILDILSNIEVKNIIAISSGASKNGSKGWASYSLSKAGVNMLINLYAKELLNTKLLAVAPGVIETPMTDYIRYEINDEIFTSAKRLKEGEIQSPKDAAERLDDVISKIEQFESGSFIDVRDI